MSDRSKYTLNGVYKCENLEQYVKMPIFPDIRLVVYIELRRSIENGRMWVYPFISNQNISKAQVRFYFNMLKKDGSSAFKIEKINVHLKWNQGCVGKYMDIEELLDENNGYLDEGALTIEYGFQMESKSIDGIWMFNFFDPLFDSKNQDNTFAFPYPNSVPIHCHKLPIKLHSNIISDSDKNVQQVECSISRWDLVVCLQIAQGVRAHWLVIDYQKVIRAAFHFGFFNTVRYCERDLIEESDENQLSIVESFELATTNNMRCYLGHVLKQIESTEQLVDILSGLDLEKMSSESMKRIVAKLFS